MGHIFRSSDDGSVYAGNNPTFSSEILKYSVFMPDCPYLSVVISAVCDQRGGKGMAAIVINIIFKPNMNRIILLSIRINLNYSDCFLL